MIEEFIPQTFLVLALAHWLALLSPGQDFVLLVTQTLHFGHQRSRYAVLGIALGNLCYIVLVILVGAKLRDYPQLFTLIQWLGVAHLGWIGVNLLKAHPAFRQRMMRYLHWLERGSGGVFITLAAMLAI